MIQQEKEMNWAKSLPKYMKCLNMIKREELAGKSQFRIYYDNNSNELLNEGKNHNSGVLLYTREKVIRMRGYQNVCSKAMRKKKNYRKYKTNENVFV